MPRQSEDGSETIFSREERLWALLIAAIGIAINIGPDHTWGHTTVGKVIGVLVGLVIFGCICIAAFGRLWNEDSSGLD